MDFEVAGDKLAADLGGPLRETLKVKAWESNGIGLVLQIDQPNRDPAAYLWLPHPGDGHTIPDIALEYPEEAGRHSGTFASAGLEKGKPALKVIVRTSGELNQTIDYFKSMAAKRPLSAVVAELPPAEALIRGCIPFAYGVDVTP